MGFESVFSRIFHEEEDDIIGGIDVTGMGILAHLETPFFFSVAISLDVPKFGAFGNLESESFIALKELLFLFFGVHILGRVFCDFGPAITVNPDNHANFSGVGHDIIRS
jgi:hypothetical protein